MSEVTNICLLGLGEVGVTLAPALLENRFTLSSFDSAFTNPQSPACANRDRFPAIVTTQDVQTAVKDADLIISAVTAAQALQAARSVAPYLQEKVWYWDLNSVAPKTKQAMADLFASHTSDRGVRFIEGAIMSPIQPLGIAAPILLGGPNARDFASIAHHIGFSGATFFSEDIGKAAASKMCRSVIIKGMESLLTESLISARFYGVENAVLNSLDNLLPGVDWQQHSAYMISRSLEHGVRRAEEMREVHKTVKDAGLIGLMSAACADTQAWTADFNQHVAPDALIPLLDKFREQL